MTIPKGVLLKCISLIQKSNINVQVVRFSATLTKQKSFDDIPGPTSLPFIGTAWNYFPVVGKFDMMHMDKIAETLYQRHGPIVRESASDIKVVHLFEPDDFETVAKATFHNPMRMGFCALHHYRDSKPELYESAGLLSLNDERWWKLRQIFQKPMSPLKETRDFLHPTDEITKEFISKLKSGIIIEDFLLLANRLNMELVCKLLFDERLNCFDEKEIGNDTFISQLISHAVSLAESLGVLDRSKIFWQIFKTKHYRRMEESLQIMEEFVQNMMNKVKTRNNSEEKCIAALYLNDPRIPEKEIVGIMIDLLLGGIHTTAITSSFMLYHVSMNPEVQRKLREEATRLLPPGTDITTSILNEAVYTRAVIKEMFRCKPIGIAQGRILPDDITLQGYRVPKNTLVVLQNYVVSHQERFFKDAKKFIPERWVKGSPHYQHVHPYILMPFGLGTRSCIARRRAEQNLHVFTLRVFGSGEVKWLGNDLGFLTPFMITPDKPVKVMFNHNS